MDVTDLKNWLETLSQTPQGAIKVINLYLSLQHGLVEAWRLRSFFEACLKLAAPTPRDALMSYDQISGTNDLYFAFKAVEPRSIEADAALSTSMKARTFHQFILGRPKTVTTMVLPLTPRTRSKEDEASYVDALRAATSRPNWFNDLGTLGKPFPDPSHIWFTLDTDLQSEIHQKPANESAGTVVRDALGLVDYRDGTFIIRLRFTGGDLHRMSGLKMSRPGFADLCSRRFLVYLDEEAEITYGREWGVTVHLKKLIQDPPVRFNGVPERVCSAIPLPQIAPSVTVDPVGWVTCNRGVNGNVDDDEGFISRISNGLSLADMIDALLEVGA